MQIELYEDPPKRIVSRKLCEKLASERLIALLKWESTGVIDYEEVGYTEKVAHWVLKLAISPDPDFSRRFRAFEMALFTHRLPFFTGITKLAWLSSQMDPLYPEEKVLYAESILKVALSSPWFTRLRVHPLSDRVRIGPTMTLTFDSYIDKTPIFRVPFRDVISLVSKRQVYLEKGWGFLPMGHIGDMCRDRLAYQLERSMAPMVGQEHKVAEFEYLMYWIRAKMRPSVPPPLVSDLNLDTFPYCMRSLYKQLTSNGHLAFSQRTSLILFLKSIGVSHQRVLSLFLQYAVGDFQKQATYSIRHLYGLEGGRKSYSCPSCKKIGCPVPATDIEDICPPQHPIKFFLQKTQGFADSEPKGIHPRVGDPKKGDPKVPASHKTQR